jgi:hypothetical protein
MNELYPIIRRKRRVLTDAQQSVPVVPVVPVVATVQPVNPPVVTVNPAPTPSAPVPPKKSRDDVSKN